MTFFPKNLISQALDSVEKYRNTTANKAYNESVDIDTFDKMWNTPIESCQRLFVVVKRR